MNSLYILKNQYDNILGVFDSLSALNEGIDFWMKQFRGVTMMFQEIKINDPENASLKWKWAFIAPNINERKFKDKGILPPQEFWDMNLAFAEFTNDYYSHHYYRRHHCHRKCGNHRLASDRWQNKATKSLNQKFWSKRTKT